MKGLRWPEPLRSYGISMKVVLAALMILFGAIPLLIQCQVMVGSFRQAQLETRGIELQNQCMILSNKMTRAGYMEAEFSGAASIDTEMQTIADAYNGRIVLVNQNYRVIKDTFNLSVGRFYPSEEVIRCFRGENSGSYNRQQQYFSQTIPVYNRNQDTVIDGVLVITASAENIISMMDGVRGKAEFFVMVAVVVLAVAAMGAVFLFMEPIRRLQRSLDQVAQGDLEADIREDSYRETRRLSAAVNKSLSKLRAVD